MVRVISSYVFFFFLAFSLLGIIVSESSQTFSQLFSLLCKDGLAYEQIIKLLYFCIWTLSLYYLIRVHLALKQDFSKTLMASIIALVFLFIWLLLVSFPERDFIDTIKFSFYEVVHLGFFSLVGMNLVEILISGFFYIFFLILPFVFWIARGHFDLEKSAHRFAYKFFPSMHVCILVLIANALQPYYDRPNLYLYIDLFVFLVALALFLIIFLREKHLFGFYEYANLLFLCVVILVVLLCSSVLAKADYYNLRYCFYLLAFLSWCGEWMLADWRQSA